MAATDNEMRINDGDVDSGLVNAADPADPTATGLGDADPADPTATGLGDADPADPTATGLGDADPNVSRSVDEETASVASVDESPKVCVQMVKDQTAYNGIDNGTTIAIKNGDGKYDVFKKGAENSPDFSPGNTYQQLVESLGGKRRKTAKRGGKSSKRGRKSAKRSRKTAKKGRKGKGSRRSKK